MWKLLQALPRGIRNSVACYARQNTSVNEQDKDLVTSNSIGCHHQPISRHQSTLRNDTRCADDHKERGGGNGEGNHRRFRVSEDCWYYLKRKHTLLEALGWCSAIAAGIVATRSSLPNRTPTSDQRQQTSADSSFLLEYALSMPFGSAAAGSARHVVDAKAVTGPTRPERTKTSRSDSGFSETSINPQSYIAQAVDRSSFDSVSFGSRSNHDDFSSDLSLDSRRSIPRVSPEFHSPLSQTQPLKQVERKNDVQTAETGAKKRDVISPDVGVASDGFVAACNQFEELCQRSYGRYCNDQAAIALKKGDDLSAVNLWMKSSAVGHSKGQYNLGRCYEHGIGTYKDLEKAKSYFRLAASQGHQAAGNRLSNILSTETSQSYVFQKQNHKQGSGGGAPATQMRES